MSYDVDRCGRMHIYRHFLRVKIIMKFQNVIVEWQLEITRLCAVLFVMLKIICCCGQDGDSNFSCVRGFTDEGWGAICTVRY